MDALIARFDRVKDNDLALCPDRGVAYQRDMTKGRVSYDEAYFNKCLGYEDQEIALEINRCRIHLVNRWVGDTGVLDVGVGSGEFIKKRWPNTFGFDVNPKAIEWLKQQKRWCDASIPFRAYTFWDVLEHVERPNDYFQHMGDGCFVFASLPIFADLEKIRESKHYRPGEHLYYWTDSGFIEFMQLYRFRLLEQRDFEISAGREAIYSYAFVRDLPGYHQTVAQYREMHSKVYGASAHLYFAPIAKEVLQLNPHSILDYGCGHSDLVAHFWKDGGRRIGRYDPAIPQHSVMPEEKFDLVLCTDVMEHILMCDVDRILGEIRAKAKRALFTISLRPARAKLPDGRNAHVTLLAESEWTRWIQSVFGAATKVPLQWDHILMLRTW